MLYLIKKKPVAVIVEAEAFRQAGCQWSIEHVGQARTADRIALGKEWGDSF
jgi:hypothetical protein